MEKHKSKRRIRKMKGWGEEEREAGREKTTEKMISCRLSIFFSRFLTSSLAATYFLPTCYYQLFAK